MQKIFMLILGSLVFVLAACSSGAATTSSGPQEFTIEASEF